MPSLVAALRPAAAIACLLSFSLLLVSSTGSAEESDASGPHVGVALGGVAGIGGGGFWGRATEGVNAAALNPTLHLDLGWRIDRRASVYARGEIGGIILFNQAALYAVGQWTPVRSLSLASGIGWDGMRTAAQSHAWSAVSIPLIVGVDVSHWDRSALRLGFEAAGDVDPSTATYGWHTAITFGWVLN